jgi:DNA repair protein RecN (Recombination protein N)
VLTSLRVENLTVLRDLELPLGPGLVVVTGETGSGKSMLIRALRLACALDGDPKWIGPAGDSARVELELEGGDEGGGLYDEEAGVWSVVARLTGTGRRYRTWEGPISAPMVRDQLSQKVRFVRQGETQLLRSTAAQRAWLDAWGELQEQVAHVGKAWEQLREARAALDEVHERARRADYERFEHEDHVRRLSEVDLDDEAYERMREHERLVTEHSGAREGIAQLLAALDESGPWGQISDLSRMASRLPDEASQAWDEFVEAQSALTGVLEDLNAQMPELDADAVLELAGRYRRLLARYGPEIDDARAALERSQDALAQLDDIEHITEEAEQRVVHAQRDYDELAAKLSEARSKAAARLAGTHLPRIFEALALHGDVSCEVTQGEAGPAGRDQVRLRMRLGKQWLDMGDISGGELSRVAVALERLAPTHETLVLDEIDTGVGGQTAHKVAAELAELAKSAQVIVVTHLAQIAQIADQHVRVSREGEVATVEVLGKQASRAEVKRMKGD